MIVALAMQEIAPDADSRKHLIITAIYAERNCENMLTSV